jgi:hypothetical protein
MASFMKDNPPQDGTLRTLTESGQPPESRLIKADEARSVVQNYIKADDEHRSWKRSRTKGLIDGNPPYDSAKHKASGRGGEPNVNWGIARSYLEAALSAFYDIFSEAPTYATCKVPYGYAESNDQAQDWEGVATEEFHCLQTDEDSFDYDMQLSQHEMVLYGVGPMMFYDTLDYRAQAMQCGKLLVPEHTKSNNERWEIAVVRQTCLPHELYGYIRNEKSASKMGWNVEFTRATIIDANTIINQGNQNRNWEWHQQCLKNGSFYYSAQSKTIQLAHIFFREFPTGDNIEGAISHKIIVENELISKEDGFLFEHVGRFKNWNECIHPMYYDHGGGGEHHSVTGMGIKLYAAMEFQNRLLCNLAGKAFAPKLMFKPTTAANKQKMSIAHFGDYGVMPADFELQQVQVAGFMQDGIGFNREISGVVASNMSQYRQNLQQKQGNPDTATKVEYDASQQSKLGKTQLNRYYDQLDYLYAEKFRRASNPGLTKSNPGGEAALAFQKRCTDRGVPIEVLRKMKVKATRIDGQGSLYERQRSLEFLLGIVAMLPETGRDNLIRRVIASRAGQSSVDALYPKSEQSKRPTDQDVIANLQVSSMHDGVPPVVSPTQNPVIFAQTFLQAGAQALASVQQGGDPHEVLAFMELVGPAAKAHIDRMSADPTRKAVVKALTDQWNQMAKTTDQLRQAIEQQMAQQQQKQQEMMMAQQRTMAINNGTDPKVMVDQALAQHKIQLDNVKTASNLRHKEMKAQQGMAIADMQAASKIRIDKEMANAKKNGREQ